MYKRQGQNGGAGGILWGNGGNGGSGSPGQPGGRGGDAGPGSYTHLRAHETTLQLVCRLLLEKKKKRNKKQQRAHTSDGYQEK